jgi:hypothetical protein
VLVVVVLVDVDPVVVLVDVVLCRPGGPEWQWFLSPYPQPGLHAVLEELVALPLPPCPLANATPVLLPPIPPAATKAPIMDRAMTAATIT